MRRVLRSGLRAFKILDWQEIQPEETVRNVDELTSTTMHHSFRQFLPDLKSQKY
ncbi:MAG: hypothetical protein HF982_07885 [Desulfobacteraceae bacterium]|nr:hypothetical protein [Desulfobacteraceae bacterium]MBC2719490.1 hypothetical protein [Desulfobacteraceae bacterium]